jgi:hypothetical protein
LVTQILLIYHAILINNEGHDAAGAIFRRVGNTSKAAGQLSIHYVAFRAAGRVWSLLGENPIEVIVIGDGAPCRLPRIFLDGGARDKRAHRALHSRPMGAYASVSSDLRRSIDN